MTFGKSCEIEMHGVDIWSEKTEFSYYSESIYAFNIFSVAFIGDNRMGYRASMWHLSRIKVSEKTLKCRIWE